MNQADYSDFHKDMEWFAFKKILTALVLLPGILAIPHIVNGISFLFRNGFDFSFWGINGVFKAVDIRFFIDYKALAFLMFLLMANRLLLFSLVKKQIKNVHLVLSFSIYIHELLWIFLLRQIGGIENPICFYFVTHVVSISSVLSPRSVRKHIYFMSICLLLYTIMDCSGIISHIVVTTPSLNVYNHPPYAICICLAIIILMFLAGGSASNAIRKATERERFKSTFIRYVSPAVAKEILEEKTILIGGESRTVTSLFADIRDFTKYSEKTTPEKVVRHLNEFFSEMVSIVFKYEGTLDKFMGDAIMATFGVPKDHPDDEIRACKAALEMKAALIKLNKKWESEYNHQFKIGIGINTGEAVAGNIGSEQRMEYTVIGDSVNTASRLEQLTKDYEAEIIISESTYQEVKDKVEAKPLDKVTLKGKTESVQVYELVGLKG